MAPRSDWRARAREVIEGVLAGLPADATPAERRRAVSNAYPFGPREHHPYRCWLKEVRLALAPRAAADPAPRNADPQVRISPHVGVLCGWCDGLDCRSGCFMCGPLRARLAACPPPRERWQEFLDAIAARPRDRALRLVYADWIEDAGFMEEAEHVRTEAAKGG